MHGWARPSSGIGPFHLLKVTRRKLRYLNAAVNLSDLRAPPGNRLESRQLMSTHRRRAVSVALQPESKAEKFCAYVAKMPKAKTPMNSHFIESEHQRR